MNYIPGFSNYLDTSVPRYADGGAVTDTVPYDLSGLDLSGLNNLYGMNFGSDFGGGLQGGGIYPTNPDLQMFQAPMSSKGNPTAYGGNYISVTSPTQVFRLLDKNTGQVVYEGSGYEGAQEAIKRADALTAEGGAKAQWQIQTPNPQQPSGYSTVANEKRNQSTVGDIASVALPIGMALLTGGMSLPAQMAAAGIGGAAGAALAGKDPLKGGLISGATAGLMGGSGLNKVIGKAVGDVGGILAGKTAEEATKQAAEKAAEQIVVTALSKAAQGTGSAIGNTLLSEGVKSGLGSVTGYKTPAERFADQPLPNTTAPPVDMYAGLNPIDVTALSKLTQGAGNAIGNTVLSGAVKGPLSDIASTDQPKTAEDIEAEKNPMVVNAYRPVNPIGGSVAAGLPALTELAMDPTLAEPAAEDIIVTGNKAIPKTVVPDALVPVGSVLAGLGLQATPTPDPALTKKPLGVEDYLSLAGKGVGLLGNIVGGGAGSDQTGTYTRGGGSLNPIFSAKLPSAGGLGTIGASRTVRPMSDEDWLTYGTRPEKSFFDYAPQATTALPTPITTPVPNEPAGPAMYVPEDMRFAEGGAFAAARGGHSRRTEFAVNGPGTGRSDDIPAVLSDGEYVMDAETVALLGDGSSKAGAKKLDELRVKVRKHKGKKLAKGRFSANAKKPEAYLSGGSI